MAHATLSLERESALPADSDALPPAGAVAGMDVGYSAKKATTGLCIIEWTPNEVTWRFRNAYSHDSSRIEALGQIAPSDGKVLAVAVDGPLVPGLALHSGYRACEAVLSKGKLQQRGKPGPTSGGSGPELHREATRLANFALNQLVVAPSTHGTRIHPQAVVEAFPNLFLGTLCDEDCYPEKPIVKRKWTDTMYPLVRDRLELLLRELLPGRTVLGRWDVHDHEEVASLACALSALCSAAGRFLAVGSDQDGYIVLPPLEALGRGWRSTLEKNVALSRRGGFPQAELRAVGAPKSA